MEAVNPMSATSNTRPNQRRRSRVIASAFAAIVIGASATACSTKSDEGDTSDGADGVKMGPGVTESTITLGVLTDLSGPFAITGKSLDQGIQIWYDQLNENGGICGREVEIDVRDMGYDLPKAISLYSEMEPDVLGFQLLLGSPQNAALEPKLVKDQVFVMPGSWASTLLGSPNRIVVGTTFDLEMMNGMSWLVDEGMIEPGDSVGHIYLQGELGENALAGSKHAAEELGLNLISQEVAPTATDVTTQITTLKNEGAKAILLSTTPGQTASAAAANASSGLNVPLLGSNPSWVPQLLDTAAGGALKEHYYVAQSYQLFSSDVPGAKNVREKYEAEYEDVPMSFTTWSYAAAAAYTTVLEKACENGDLSREGVLAAFPEVTEVDTEGIMPPLDFSDPNVPPTREVLIARPDSSAPGGLTVVRDAESSDIADNHQFPADG
jgi:ABC-type branched-subunit amino acid transport system substrate-binding protein